MKTYSMQENIGKARYAVSFHDGVKVHSDNSPFRDIRVFSNKRKCNKFIQSLKISGYVAH